MQTINIYKKMSVYYKFNAARDYDTLPIDGLYITLAALKEGITHQKRLGKGLCDLKITNAETKEGKDSTDME